MAWAARRGTTASPIARTSGAVQSGVVRGRRSPTFVGVNRHTEGDNDETPILRIDPALERKQVDRVRAVRAARDTGAVERKLAALRSAAADERNLMRMVASGRLGRKTGGGLIARPA
jgi:methylmalonyl-CoA mutase, N-terminal domain